MTVYPLFLWDTPAALLAAVNVAKHVVVVWAVYAESTDPHHARLAHRLGLPRDYRPVWWLSVPPPGIPAATQSRFVPMAMSGRAVLGQYRTAADRYVCAIPGRFPYARRPPRST